MRRFEIERALHMFSKCGMSWHKLLAFHCFQLKFPLSFLFPLICFKLNQTNSSKINRNVHSTSHMDMRLPLQINTHPNLIYQVSNFSYIALFLLYYWIFLLFFSHYLIRVMLQFLGRYVSFEVMLVVILMTPWEKTE